MSKPRLLVSAGFLAASALLCSACAPPQQTIEAASTSAQQVADSAGMPIKQAGDASPGKPTAPIAISYELSAEPQVAQPLEVRITARVAAGMSGPTLDVESNDALLIGAVSPEGSAGADANERVWTVTVTPLQDGSAYLNLAVSAELDGQELSRSLMIPIPVGDAKPAAESASAVKIDESGEALIVLPAEETP